MRRDTDLPAPPGVGPVKSPPFWRWLIALALAIAVVIAAFTLPLPIFFAYLPGPVESVEPLVEVDGARTYSSEGDLLMTTVLVDTSVTAWELLRAAVDRSSAVVMREDVTQGRPVDELERIQQEAMNDSKRSAETVALEAAGLATIETSGVRVETALEGYPAEGVLREGDVIRSVDGRSVADTCDVGDAIAAHEPGERIDFEVERNGNRTRETLRAATGPSSSDPFVGIQMSNIDYRFEAGVDIDIDTGRIAGPSGGLMMTLAIYDRLTDQDLTGGRKIAGTGEIALCGEVGPIGGIEQKVAGAEREGAEVFLAPAGNYEAARAAARSVEVVRVDRFSDAVEYLEAR